jgi:hypothetical protein
LVALLLQTLLLQVLLRLALLLDAQILVTLALFARALLTQALFTQLLFTQQFLPPLFLVLAFLQQPFPALAFLALAIGVIDTRGSLTEGRRRALLARRSAVAIIVPEIQVKLIVALAVRIVRGGIPIHGTLRPRIRCVAELIAFTPVVTMAARCVGLTS